MIAPELEMNHETNASEVSDVSATVIALSARVGKCIGKKNPSYPGFTTIVVMMKSHSKWWPLGPYYSTVDGCIMDSGACDSECVAVLDERSDCEARARCMRSCQSRLSTTVRMTGRRSGMRRLDVAAARLACCDPSGGRRAYT